MKMTDQVYNIVKWVALVVLPGLGSLYATLAEIWQWPYLAEIPGTLQAICFFLGALIGISTAEYNRELGEGDN